MPEPEPKFEGKAYLKRSYLDKHGAKMLTFEFSAQEAVAIAKLELMGRDLDNFLPVLLDVTVKVAKDKGSFTKFDNAPPQKRKIPNRRSAQR